MLCCQMQHLSAHAQTPGMASASMFAERELMKVQQNHKLLLFAPQYQNNQNFFITSRGREGEPTDTEVGAMGLSAAEW